MKTSDQITDLLTALCAARLDVPTITRNREGFSKRTGQKYQYADLNALIDATEPVLGQHGLVLVQSVDDGEEGTLRITSTLFHATSGQWMSSEVSVEKPADMQNFGMICTYLKRYAQQSLLNISTEDDDDAASLNGSNKPETSAAADHRRASGPVSTNGHTPEPDASLAHPTEAHLAALANLALTECHEDKEVYYQRIRTTMRLKPHASVAPRLLTRTMSMVHYMELFTYYQKLAEQLARKTPEVSHGTASAQNPASESAPAPTTEAVSQDPPADSGGASSSAVSSPDADADERDRVRLRQEVASWDLRVSQEEQEFIIARHPYSKARALLWTCRRQAQTTLEATAAD